MELPENISKSSQTENVVETSTTSEKIDLTRLLALRAANADAFYNILITLTNRQLNELCHTDPKRDFCNNIAFWEGLWRAHKTWGPLPKVDLTRLSRIYQERNLINSILEELSRDEEKYLIQQANNFDKTHSYPINQLPLWRRLEQILTETNDGQGLKYLTPILNTAIEHFNGDLLYYYFLNLPRMDWHDLENTILRTSTPDQDLFVDSVLASFTMLSSLPFIYNSDIVDIVKFVLKNCSPRRVTIIQVTLGLRNFEVEDFRELFSYHLQINTCPLLENILVNYIRKMKQEDQKEIKDYVFRHYDGIFYGLINPEDVERYLEIADKDNIEKLLTDWHVDIVSLLQKLIEEDEWPQVRKIVAQLSFFNLENKEYYRDDQKGLYILFKELRNPRRRGFTKGIESVFVKSLNQPYLVPAFRMAVIKDKVPLKYFENFFESPLIRKLSIVDLGSILNAVRHVDEPLADQLVEELTENDA